MHIFVSFILFALLGVDGFVVSPLWTASPVSTISRGQYMRIAVVLARHENDESSYHYILNKAREYAFSDFTTVNEAKQYLTYILELESACMSGDAVGHDICDNVLEVTDIVAHLRQKADQKQAMSARCVHMSLTLRCLVEVFCLKSFFPYFSSKEALLVASLGSLTALLIFLSSFLEPKADVVPFTWEEWIWAMQGGYLDSMVAHFIRNGGL